MAGPVTVPSDSAVAVHATSGGLPKGAPLAVSSAVTVEVVSRLHTFNFPTPARPTAGTTYALIVTVTGANEINVGVAPTTRYAEGAPATMMPKSSFDLTFQASFVPCARRRSPRLRAARRLGS